MLDYLYPQTVETVRSKYNGTIKVTKSRGKYSVWVGGFEQSGPVYVEKLWEKALKELPLPKQGELLRNIKVLILGLGCGTVVPLILQRWPNAKITGVEIDPEMIRLGKKYFALDTYKNLRIVQADARKLKLTNYDFVLSDAYFGGKNQLKKLKVSGIVLTNIFSPRFLKNNITIS